MMLRNRQISLVLTTAMLTACAVSPSLASSAAKKSAAGHGKPKSSGHGAAKKETKKPVHVTTGHGDVKESKQEPSSQAGDVERILSLIADKEKKHDPRLYIEVNLGEFRVTRPGEDEDEIVVVKFQIFGVLNERDKLKFDESSLGREQRLRDAVLSVVHSSELDELMDPALDQVKSELVAAINRILESDFLRDVAFSSFSMEPN
jgi:flagellar basal body-associated protein FliL